MNNILDTLKLWLYFSYFYYHKIDPFSRLPKYVPKIWTKTPKADDLSRFVHQSCGFRLNPTICNFTSLFRFLLINVNVNLKTSSDTLFVLFTRSSEYNVQHIQELLQARTASEKCIFIGNVRKKCDQIIKQCRLAMEITSSYLKLSKKNLTEVYNNSLMSYISLFQ